MTKLNLVTKPPLKSRLDKAVKGKRISVFRPAINQKSVQPPLPHPTTAGTTVSDLICTRHDVFAPQLAGSSDHISYQPQLQINEGAAGYPSVVDGFRLSSLALQDSIARIR